MLDFHEFAKSVHSRFVEITSDPETPVFVTSVTGEALWDTYLKAFPEGTNPIFRERTEHDCACCRNFVKNLGRIVVLRSDGSYRTVWDIVDVVQGTYGIVAARMAAAVCDHPIEAVYRTKESGYGAETTYEALPTGQTLTWHHFHGRVPSRLVAPNPGEAIGDVAASFQVLHRGLEELSVEALEIVDGLIAENALYRGEEHLSAVRDFLALKRAYVDVPRDPRQKATFAWQHVTRRARARFKNTVIGTLVQDLSEGMSVEAAVARFETKVAPQNYRRPTALITTAMVESAVGTLRGLGLESAVRRRFAVVADVSVNDVLFVDRNVRPHMKDSLTDLLMGEVRARTAWRQAANAAAKDVTGEEFVERILPGAESVELLLDSAHLGNFVSLTAPQEADAGRLFAWDNGFAWAYDGDVTDGIKERVKKAGGNVDALLRVSLSWSNYDDLDLHCETPHGSHIYFGAKQGVLDVDMNAGAGRSREPVENLAFSSPTLTGGRYRIWVNQFNQRERCDVGFEIEYAHLGDVRRYHYPKAMAHGQTVRVMDILVRDGQVVEVTPDEDMEEGATSAAVVAKWGLTTGQTASVDMVMLSPNYWEGAGGRGNKHHIFVLRGCKNPERARGFFNEFLRPDLVPHRKVFEVLGSKTMCEPADNQLSGVGFSSTRHDRATFIVRKGDTTRTYNVQF